MTDTYDTDLERVTQELLDEQALNAIQRGEVVKQEERILRLLDIIEDFCNHLQDLNSD